MTLLEWIKANVKDGVSLSDAEKMVKDLEDLDPLKSVRTNEEALAFIERNQVFKSAFDSETSKRIANHDERFKADKLPGLIKEERDKIAKELNPDLTEDQKRIAELEAKIKQGETEKAVSTAKAELRAKANELKYDPIEAESFYVYGDKAIERLESHAKYIQDTVNTRVEGEIKTRFSGVTPKKIIDDPAKVMNRADYDNLRTSNPDAAAQFFKDGGKLQD